MILNTATKKKVDLEDYFLNFKHNVLGEDYYIKTPYHEAIRVIYTDWTASGRLYLPIENHLREHIYPLVANTHTKDSYTGYAMTYAYEKARQVIKEHVNASDNDILISACSGMTGVVNKLQRMMGIRLHESHKHLVKLKEEDKPVVFITHMEHHSNQTSWLETTADVVIIQPDENGLVSLDNLEELLLKYGNRKNKIASITACSNVTGVKTPYHDVAELMHKYNGLCFVDFSASAPYVTIDMHDDDQAGRYLDAIFFSPHKFLGGPGATGILVFNKKLYQNAIPDNSGGGTVDWTNPWGEHKYVDNIEEKEDGGTPAFLQTIRAAMAMILKDEMGVENIELKENQIVEIFFDKLKNVENLHILAEQHKDRLPVFSLYIDDLHYKLAVKMLNDKFGIQARGGCSCAGTYGHHLLNVNKEHSDKITCSINSGDLSTKPGWVRISFHPTQTIDEVLYVVSSLKKLARNYTKWADDYEIDLFKSKFTNKLLDEDELVKASINYSFKGDFLYHS